MAPLARRARDVQDRGVVRDRRCCGRSCPTRSSHSADIGLMLGVVGFSAALAGAVVGGAATRGLGRRRALLGFGVAADARDRVDGARGRVPVGADVLRGHGRGAPDLGDGDRGAVHRDDGLLPARRGGHRLHRPGLGRRDRDGRRLDALGPLGRTRSATARTSSPRPRSRRPASRSPRPTARAIRTSRWCRRSAAALTAGSGPGAARSRRSVRRRDRAARAAW